MSREATGQSISCILVDELQHFSISEKFLLLYKNTTELLFMSVLLTMMLSTPESISYSNQCKAHWQVAQIGFQGAPFLMQKSLPPLFTLIHMSKGNERVNLVLIFRATVLCCHVFHLKWQNKRWAIQSQLKRISCNSTNSQLLCWVT